MPTRIAIKNMVCNRCIKVVRDELIDLGFQPVDVRLGEVILDREPSTAERNAILVSMEQNGFELLDDKRKKLIEQIKIAIIDVIQHGDENVLSRIVFSQYLSEKLEAEYSHLSTLFSQTEGITLEKYVILQKTERVKELMLYNELTLSEIAYRLGYSSVHHLSNQFKKVTGMTPTAFKKVGHARRESLDSVQSKKR